MVFEPERYAKPGIRDPFFIALPLIDSYMKWFLSLILPSPVLECFSQILPVDKRVSSEIFSLYQQRKISPLSNSMTAPKWDPDHCARRNGNNPRNGKRRPLPDNPTV